MVTPALWKLRPVRVTQWDHPPLSFYYLLHTYSSRSEPYLCQPGKTLQKEYLSCDQQIATMPCTKALRPCREIEGWSLISTKLGLRLHFLFSNLLKQCNWSHQHSFPTSDYQLLQNAVSMNFLHYALTSHYWWILFKAPYSTPGKNINLPLKW